MSTGDLKNNLRKLQLETKSVKYTEELDIDGLTKGEVNALLPIYHYVFLNYSPLVAKEISDADIDLSGKTDLRFMESVYKALRELYTYKPPITKIQFFSAGYSEKKIIMAYQITNLVRDRHKKLQPSRKKSAMLGSSSLSNLTKSKPPLSSSFNAGVRSVIPKVPDQSISQSRMSLGRSWRPSSGRKNETRSSYVEAVAVEKSRVKSQDTNAQVVSEISGHIPTFKSKHHQREERSASHTTLTQPPAQPTNTQARIIKPDLVKMSGSVEVSTSGAWAPLETPGVATSSSDLANENNLLPQNSGGNPPEAWRKDEGYHTGATSPVMQPECRCDCAEKIKQITEAYEKLATEHQSVQDRLSNLETNSNFSEAQLTEIVRKILTQEHESILARLTILETKSTVYEAQHLTNGVSSSCDVVSRSAESVMSPMQTVNRSLHQVSPPKHTPVLVQGELTTSSPSKLYDQKKYSDNDGKDLENPPSPIPPEMSRSVDGGKTDEDLIRSSTPTSSLQQISDIHSSSVQEKAKNIVDMFKNTEELLMQKAAFSLEETDPDEPAVSVADRDS